MNDSNNIIVSLPTRFGNYKLHYYADISSGKEHLALVMGNIKGGSNVLTRIHSECLTGDIFGSLRCDCGEQLNNSLQLIAAEGMGVLIYLRQEGRGIGLLEKLKAYSLQENGYDTVDANLKLGHQIDSRQYNVAVNILNDMGVNSVRLLTNNPVKIKALQALGIIVEQVSPLQPTINEYNKFYLETKKARMGHTILINE